MNPKSFWLLGLGLTLALSPAAAQQTPAPKKVTKPAPAPGGTKLVEKVTRKGSELVIPYEKYVLPNGLTLIVHEDHSDPLVHVDVTYHVGSAREEIGKSGFAHFFEHMMFQGSDHVADEQHFKIVTAAGGTLNGSTNRDRTNYYETLPSNQLETALWLEADRMGFLLDAVTQQKFEVQRSTVKNERGQNYDNRPYGLAGENVTKTLYPYGHPYSWMTIGYLEDLDRSNVNDLKNFFLRWYGPNNATLTVGGDVKPAEVVKLVEKYFGPIKRGPAVAKHEAARPRAHRRPLRELPGQHALPDAANGVPDRAPVPPRRSSPGCAGRNPGRRQKLLALQKPGEDPESRAGAGYQPSSELAGRVWHYGPALPRQRPRQHGGHRAQHAGRV